VAALLLATTEVRLFPCVCHGESFKDSLETGVGLKMSKAGRRRKNSKTVSNGKESNAKEEK
jgi:hypothetical protein